MDAWVWWILVAGAGFLLVEFALRVSVLTLILPIFERRPPFNVRPAEPDLDAELVRFRTSDGLCLSGSLYRPVGEPQGLVVFCPEFGGTHWSAPLYAGGLIDAGFAVLSFDFRNQGESDEEPGYAPTHWLTVKEVDDALAALAYARSREDLASLPIGVFGVSRGANAALVAAARSRQVLCVAVDGAFSTDAMMLYYAYRWAELYVPGWMIRLVPEWHLAETMRFARRVSGLRHGVRYAILERWLPRLAGRPLLMITGERDSYVAPAIAERMRRRIGRACLPIWVVPGAKHNQARTTLPEEYDRRLADFFSHAMAGSTARPEMERYAAAAR